MKFADENKVNMTPAQRSQNRAKLQAEARMASQPSGRAINEVKEQQMGRMNQIILDRYGIQGDAFTPDVLGPMTLSLPATTRLAKPTRTVGDDSS